MAFRFRSSTQGQTKGAAVGSAAEFCPYRLTLFGQTISHAIIAPAQQASRAPTLAYSTAIAQTVLLARISEARSHHKRGPPPSEA